MKLLIPFVLLLLISCAATVYMTGEPREKISKSEVKEYQVKPDNAQEIAMVTVQLKSSIGETEAKGLIKKKAASLGANGFAITSKHVSSSFNASPLYNFEAVVFYVTK